MTDGGQGFIMQYDACFQTKNIRPMWVMDNELLKSASLFDAAGKPSCKALLAVDCHHIKVY